MTRFVMNGGEGMSLTRFKRETLCRPRLPLAPVFLVACLFPTLAFAQNDSWLGGNGLWSDASKWSAGVPTSSNSVLIDNGKTGASPVTINYNGAQCGSLTIDGDDSLTLTDTTIFTVFGPTISNSGVILLNATSGQAILDISGSVTLKGSGGLTMSNNAGNTMMGYAQPSGASFTNQTTIQGAGSIGSPGGGSVTNQGTINANQSTPLTMAIGPATTTNTGTLEATNGGTLVLAGGSTLTNTGGTIHADNASSVWLKDGPTIKNGTLTTSGTGTIQQVSGGNYATLDGVTINGTFQVNALIQFLANTITNNGSFQINNGTIVDVVGATTLKGTGTLIMSNNSNNSIMGYAQASPGASLTNQITIQGAGNIGGNGIPTGDSLTNQGTINANQAGTPLVLAAGPATIVNTGTLEATNGATLTIAGSASVNNTSGTIHADPGSIVVLRDGEGVSNGTLTSSGTGLIQCIGNNGACLLDGVTINGTYQVANGIGTLTNTVTNNGSFQLGISSNSATLDIVGAATLKGSGTLTMSNFLGNQIFGYGQQSGATLNNQSTIEGAGTISPGSSNSFINQHIVSANQPLTISGNFSNTGTLKVSKSKTLNITGGLFSNFSGSTLTGGKYMVNGTLGFDGANIVTNAAGITLTGSKSQIINDLNAANALTNFATNTKTGSLSLMSGKALATAGNLSNAGKIKVGAGSSLQVGTSPNGTYTQTAGTTTVDGVLTAPTGVVIQGGKVFGKGTIAGTVVSSGAFTAGDTSKKAGKLSPSTYTQNANASLNIAIGGLTVGTQYGQLAVANGASLNGTLNVTLINNFLPAIGDSFTILTCSARTGQFATVNGLSINSSEHFQITYGPTSVTLTVASGP